MSLQFYREWFGMHGGREVFHKDRGTRMFIDSWLALPPYIEKCCVNRLPAYMSVQPYRGRDVPLGIEKVFFEFDCEKDVEKAWRDARTLCNAIVRFYDAVPFIKFSGRRGFHVDVFLKEIVAFNPTPHTIKLVKEVYARLQQKILAGLELPTLDKQVLGDIKRLERIPYTLHEESGKPCQPVSLKGELIPPEDCDIEYYRKNGLSPSLLQEVLHEVRVEEKWRSLFEGSLKKHSQKNKGSGKIRPCIEAALRHPLNGEGGHMMRLAVACEFLNKGYTVGEVVELFRNQPDFNPSKTRYYVEDAKKKCYKPFKCETIRRLGYCLDEKCPLRARNMMKYARKQM